MDLKEYIDKYYKGNQSAFADSQGVKPPQVTQWLKSGFVVIDHKLHSGVRRVLVLPDFNKLVSDHLDSFIDIQQSIHESTSNRYVWFAINPSGDQTSEWGEYRECFDIHDKDDYRTIMTFKTRDSALKRARDVLRNNDHFFRMAVSLAKDEIEYRKST